MSNKKFRAYHHGFGKYLANDEWYINFNGELCFIDFGGITDDYLVKVPEKMYVLEQFTGLYDEAGKEIYENDILLFEADYEEMVEGEGNIIGLVVFTHGYYYFMDDQTDEPLHCFSEKQTESLELKIIGNIHENKELLN